MSFNRRSFLYHLSLGGVSTFSPMLYRAIQRIAELSAVDAARDEAFWREVRMQYITSSDLIDLNNGGVSPQPRIVTEALQRLQTQANQAPSYQLWRVLDKGREPLRRRLATLTGCDAEELAINRNATEGLETVIFGCQLEAGDEVIYSRQDYPHVVHAWKQRAQREGIILKELDFDFPITDKQQLVDTFVNAIGPRTKMLTVTHMVNWNGQVMPVREICAAARARGVRTLVDAAHTVAQFDFNIRDLDCDYLAASLHKWLGAPLGSGMLYVRRERIGELYPLFAAAEPLSDDIRKFEHLGTRSIPIEQAIAQAIEFHELIGAGRKEERLRFLKEYWTERAATIPGVSILTPHERAFSGVIGLFNIEGKKAASVSDFLLRHFRIHSSPTNWENIQGVRISPNVYTLTFELDLLLKGIAECARA